VSILLIDPLPELGRAVVERLVSEGDEVRVLTSAPADWANRNAFIASGDPFDVDLVERACTNVRTIVFTFDRRKGQAPLMSAVVPAARNAGVDRVVVCAPVVDDAVGRLLVDSDHVVLLTGRKGFVPRRLVEAEKVAEAVSAADDLDGQPRLVVDLTSEEGWRLLGAHA
jgi:NAD(P)H-binding